MSLSLPEVRARTARLLEALDGEIVLLARRQEQMAALSEAIVQRDEGRLEALLAEVAGTLSAQAEADERVRALQAELARRLGCPPETARLGLLAERVGGREGSEMQSRRDRIVELADGLRRQHLRTSVLLTECARVNRRMLETLCPAARGVSTYDSGGREHWRPETGRVSAER